MYFLKLQISIFFFWASILFQRLIKNDTNKG
jgi:hypothetical protein